MSNKICSVEDCPKGAICKGFCDKHYRRNKLYGDPLAVSRPPRECSVEGCDTRARCKGMCSMHYQRNKRLGSPGQPGRITNENAGKPCSFEGCGGPAARSGLCWSHDAQKRRGRPLTPLRESYGRGMSVEEKLERFSLPKNEDGCRIWVGGVQENGYPTIAANWTGSKLTHRVAYMVNAGERILGDTQVHHICANSACVEPTHLQAVRPHENVAEMLERRYYRNRIADLESALAEFDPNHKLLEGVA